MVITFLPSEIIAADIRAQIKGLETIQNKRKVASR
jgi:hypothetical protein